MYYAQSLSQTFENVFFFVGWEVPSDCSEDDLGIKQDNYTLTKNLKSGSLLVYQCAEAFYPQPTTRRCQSNGHWTPSSKRFPQTCKPVECPHPNVLENGNVFPFQERYSVDHITMYECYPGYTLQGFSSRTCLSNGKWSGSTPICSHDIKFTYDSAVEVAEALLMSLGESLTNLQPKDDAQASRPIRIAKPGKLNIYIALDISDNIEEIIIERTKLAIITLIKKISAFTVSPNYEILFFSADVYEVVSIVDFYEGNVTLDSTIKNLEDFQIGGKGLKKNLFFFYTNYILVLCFKQKTGDEFREHRHVFLLFTDGAYNMGGSPLPTLARIKNRVYMSPTGDPGSRLDYLGDYIFGIGAEIFDEALLHKFSTFGFSYLDNDALQNRCGLQKDYELEEDGDSKRKRYPWFALIRIQMQGRTMFCSGSLVSPHFFLTAAHCFPSGYKPENIKVEIDDKHGRKDKNVKKIFVHPNFNIKAREEQGVTEFYDYDIALNQLEDPYSMEYFIGSSQTSNALKLPGRSTCIQQEELLLKNQKEKLNFLSENGDSAGVKEKRQTIVVSEFLHCSLFAAVYSAISKLSAL
uniref:C3/C5 convertase n=1 Tax=Oryzias sinensis TaxID=183150 RepID=A0A8C7ZN55_9TELE